MTLLPNRRSYRQNKHHIVSANPAVSQPPKSPDPQQASLPRQDPFSFYKFHKEIYIPTLQAYGTMGDAG